MALTDPRGIRNNNPGNIDYLPSMQWEGLATPPSDGRFCIFLTPEYGIRAIAKTLHTYELRGLSTIRQVIDEWAPPSENDTAAYIADVAGKLGIGADDPRLWFCANAMQFLIPAIIAHENGQQPYDTATLCRGIAMAAQNADSGVAAAPAPGAPSA